MRQMSHPRCLRRCAAAVILRCVVRDKQAVDVLLGVRLCYVVYNENVIPKLEIMSCHCPGVGMVGDHIISAAEAWI